MVRSDWHETGEPGEYKRKWYHWGRYWIGIVKLSGLGGASSYEWYVALVDGIPDPDFPIEKSGLAEDVEQAEIAAENAYEKLRGPHSF